MKKKFKKNILIVTGGTGGHIYPALTIYDELINNKLCISIITDIRGYNNQHLSKYKPDIINVKGYAGKSLINKIISIFLVFICSIKSFFILKRKNIKLVIGFGSYVQVPVLIAARILKIDVILHEANAVLGKANKIFWNFVTLRTSAYKIVYNNLDSIVLGTPVRKEIVKLFNRPFKEPLKQKRYRILILGGSQGSLVLSKNISKCLSNLPYKLRKNIHVTHQVKKDQIKKVIFDYKLANIKADVKEFIENVPYNLQVSHLVICRAGASTIAENLTAKIPAIYIPLSTAIEDHQNLNIENISAMKAAWTFSEEKILKNEFIKLIKKILTTKGLLSSYSNNAKSLAKPYASKKFCNLVIGVVDAKL